VLHTAISATRCQAHLQRVAQTSSFLPLLTSLSQLVSYTHEVMASSPWYKTFFALYKTDRTNETEVARLKIGQNAPPLNKFAGTTSTKSLTTNKIFGQ
jgi:hypothetical protein